MTRGHSGTSETTEELAIQSLGLTCSTHLYHGNFNQLISIIYEAVVTLIRCWNQKGSACEHKKIVIVITLVKSVVILYSYHRKINQNNHVSFSN